MKLKIYGDTEWLQPRVSVFALHRVVTIDSIILIVLGAGAIIGFMKGFIQQLASILGLIVELLAAKALYTPLVVKLCPTVADSMTVAQILTFVIIWITVSLIFTLVASVLTEAVEVVSLGWLNRPLGIGPEALKYLLLASLVVCVIQFADTDSQLISQTRKKESLLCYPIERFAGMFFPAAEEVTQ